MGAVYRVSAASPQAWEEISVGGTEPPRSFITIETAAHQLAPASDLCFHHTKYGHCDACCATDGSGLAGG
jgi:hypothetical protein